MQIPQAAVSQLSLQTLLLKSNIISNTGSKKQPYGNGGVRYDDIYMSPGTVLTTP